MAVNKEFCDHIVDILHVIGEINYRPMFGGIGITHHGIFFALIADDTLYFKVDDSNRYDYVAADAQPFKPFKNRPAKMPYYQVPPEILEDRDKLRAWALLAIAVARKVPIKPPRKFMKHFSVN